MGPCVVKNISKGNTAYVMSTSPERYFIAVGDLYITERAYDVLYDSELVMLPEKVQRRLGLSTPTGRFYQDNELQILTNLNDVEDADFNQIAERR